MRVIGITGPMGAGKSTVAGWLGGWGAVVVDSDALVREIYAADPEMRAQLVRRFGGHVVAGNTVDRRALAGAVFGDTAALADLEAIVHPVVRRRRDERLAEARAAGAPACVVEAIKLVESGGSAACDELWIVVAADAVLRRRLLARGLDEDEIRRRLAAQGTVAGWMEQFLAESERLDRYRPIVVFDNTGDKERGQAEAARLWHGVL